MQTIIIVGVIGSGKTTLARKLADTRTTYISFDTSWHTDMQHEGHTPVTATKRFAELCNMQENTVIDGWWTWTNEWWKTAKDNTLSLMPNIRLIHLQPTLDEAYASYVRKLEAKEYIKQRCLSDSETYKKTLPLRMAYLSRKVKEWGM